jgi:RES domain-containing protein
MRLWRISNYADLSGEGGRRAAGRWHERGTPTVYMAENPALAMVEVLVHLEIDREDMPTSYQLIGVEVPDAIKVEDVILAELDKNIPGWRTSAALTRKLAASWFSEARSPLLRVPSVLVPHSSNFLLNPLHPDSGLLKIVSVEKAEYDQRIFLGTDMSGTAAGSI